MLEHVQKDDGVVAAAAQVDGPFDVGFDIVGVGVALEGFGHDLDVDAVPALDPIRQRETLRRQLRSAHEGEHLALSDSDLEHPQRPAEPLVLLVEQHAAEPVAQEANWIARRGDLPAMATAELEPGDVIEAIERPTQMSHGDWPIHSVNSGP